MVEVLKGPAVGASGVWYPAGHVVPESEPDWFIEDLRVAGMIVEVEAKPASRAATAGSRKKAPRAPRERRGN